MIYGPGYFPPILSKAEASKPKSSNMFSTLGINTPSLLAKLYALDSEADDRTVLLGKYVLDVHDKVDEARLHLAKVRYQPIGLIDSRKAYQNFDQVLLAVKKVVEISVENLANVNTTGYKRINPSVKSDSARVHRVYDTVQGDPIRSERTLTS